LILALGPVGVGEDEVVLIAYITSNPHHVQNPRLGDLRLDETDNCGLDQPSVVRCRQFSCVPRAGIGQLLGEISTGCLIEAQDIARAILCEDGITNL
jgi:hypothetical protein